MKILYYRDIKNDGKDVGIDGSEGDGGGGGGEDSNDVLGKVEKNY